VALYQVILAYDGSEFFGFQRTPKNRTVQGIVEVVLRQLGWQERSIVSAGRTDAGVHADGQVIAFSLEWKAGSRELQAALNANLPQDVSAVAVQEARPGFHPRYDAQARRYRYRIFCQEWRNPLRERYAWRVWPAVDLGSIQASAQCLPGKHDFAAFGTPPRSGGSTIRTVFRADWQVEGDELIFDILAEAFLYHMVRHLVAFQVKIGQGKLPPEGLANLLQGEDQVPVQILAPPQGLTLVEVLYPLQTE
jgi:tRNA pseudouridine38-40 synthase